MEDQPNPVALLQEERERQRQTKTALDEGGMQLESARRADGLGRQVARDRTDVWMDQDQEKQWFDRAIAHALQADAL